MVGQQQIPFFNGANKYLNPVIDDNGIFRLPTKFVLRECQTKRLIVFNRKDDTTMEIVPFDTIEQDDDWMTFKFVFNTDNNLLPIWDANLLRRFHWSWYEKMYEGLHTNWFINLNKQLNVTERLTKTIFPVKEKVYRCFDSSYGHVKVVIVGQSPYPNKEHANGIAFASDSDVVPVSLQKIKEAIGTEIPNNLQSWVDQGVMLLNSSLTVSDTKQEYFDEWKPFIKLVFQTLATKKNLTWILMGAKARSYKTLIPTHHHIIECEHPAAAAYDKRAWDYKDCFLSANAYLEQDQISPIKWNLL